MGHFLHFILFPQLSGNHLSETLRTSSPGLPFTLTRLPSPCGHLLLRPPSSESRKDFNQRLTPLLCASLRCTGSERHPVVLNTAADAQQMPTQGASCGADMDDILRLLSFLQNRATLLPAVPVMSSDLTNVWLTSKSVTFLSRDGFIV